MVELNIFSMFILALVLLVNYAYAACYVSHCQKCTSTSSNQCSACEEGYRVNNGKCDPCSDPACNLCSTAVDKCSACIEHYGLNNGKCVKCKDPNCKKCSDKYD